MLPLSISDSQLFHSVKEVKVLVGSLLHLLCRTSSAVPAVSHCHLPKLEDSWFLPSRCILKCLISPVPINTFCECCKYIAQGASIACENKATFFSYTVVLRMHRICWFMANILLAFQQREVLICILSKYLEGILLCLFISQITQLDTN